MALAPIAREAFLLRLEELVDLAQSDSEDLALLLVDLSNLRHINHQHAFSIGDALLLELGEQLLGMAKREGTVFRIASHTYAVIVPQVAQIALLPVVVGRMRSILQKSLQMDAHFMQAKLKFAVGLNRGGSQSALLTLAAAETHLASLRCGHNEDLDDFLASGVDQSAEIGHLIQPFSQALRDSQFVLAYQPKVDINSGELVGAEALLRWPDPQRGNISPELAVQVAETSNRIFELTKWVVHTAARQHREWLQEGVSVPLSVNVPPSILLRPDLAAMLEGAMQIWNMSETDLTLEITEQGLITDPEAATRAMERLRNSGFKISIDDFGTGYSSLSYFHDIPATELKVDRSFVSRLKDSEKDRGIVRTVNELARVFGMQVVAEGVEDQHTLALLRDLGCDVLQGFGVSRPLSPEEFLTWRDDRALKLSLPYSLP